MVENFQLESETSIIYSPYKRSNSAFVPFLDLRIIISKMEHLLMHP
jgi:hypothetical protein